MGKAYTEEQRNTVKLLLEAGRDEESIEKETGVSDRTIRRWKLELERTGRIGKPPESRTGRHRVLTPEVEAALFEYVKDKPEMSVDDMLWWLYDTYKIVVGTRTIRRVFERKGDRAISKSKSKGSARGAVVSGVQDAEENIDDNHGDNTENGTQINPMQTTNVHFSSPYPAMNSELPAEEQLVQAFQHQNAQPIYPPPPPMHLDDGDLPDDEETLKLQLEQIALQKREVELKLKMRRLQAGKGGPVSGQKSTPSEVDPAPSILYNPNAIIPTGPKRDSRSKKKIEESRRRTAERQERMLRELERRSRRRDHLTAEWVTSKDIWPLRAQGLLADLMHRYGCYSTSQNDPETFEAMYRELYQLVDLTKGDWAPQVHDEMLRERTKRKMGQLRAKMQKTGEIIARTDGYGGFQKAEDYTGEQAGAAVGDESDIVNDLTPLPDEQQEIHYEPVPDHMQGSLPYSIPPQYPIMDQSLLRAQGPFFS